jgi:hypothetical protein
MGQDFVFLFGANQTEVQLDFVDLASRFHSEYQDRGCPEAVRMKIAQRGLQAGLLLKLDQQKQLK